MLFLHLVGQAAHFGLHLGELVLRHHAAVHVEHVLAGQRIDVGHVGLFLGGLEGADRRLVQVVLVGELLVEALVLHHQLAGGLEGVDAERRAAGVTLLAVRYHLHPHDRLLGHLYQRAVLAAGVRHEEHVLLAEDLGLVVGDVVGAETGAGLLVGAEQQGYVVLGAVVQVHHGLHHHHAGGYGLLVVLHAAAYEFPVLHFHLVRVGVPQLGFAGRHHVEVGHEPDGLLIALALVAGYQVGADAVLGFLLRGVDPLYRIELQLLQLAFQPLGLVVLAGAAGGRGQRRYGGEAALQLYGVVLVGFYFFEDLVFHGILLWKIIKVYLIPRRPGSVRAPFRWRRVDFRGK